MKKLISIFLMAMLLMTTVPFTTLANGDLLEVYNSATGEATYETPMNANVQQMYTDLRYYSSTSTGTRSTSADINTGAASAIGWGSGKGNYVTFMRFPLSAVAVAEGKRIDSVTLNVTFAEAYDFTSSNRVLAAYKDFTTTTLGETISYLDKTYSDLTANTNLVGSVELNKSYEAGDTVSIDVTDYVRSLVDAGASSADFALTIPDADAQYKIYPVQRKLSSGSNVKLKPHLSVITEVAADSYPTIDTVANEGKTKIQMQTTAADTFSNTSVDVFYGSGKTLTYNVNCKTAGEYYLTVYIVNKYSGSKKCTLTVNDGASITESLSSSNAVDGATEAQVRSRLKAHKFAINLVQGKNVIELSPGSSNLGLCLVELTNYNRAEIGDGYNITEKGIEVRAINQPKVTDYPTVVYKVYDTIAAAKAAGVTSANLTAQISNATSDRLVETVSFIAATYNSQKQLENVEIVSYDEIAKSTQNTIDFGSFQIDDVEKIKFFVWTDGTLKPITASASIEE